jgi:hypothetical protein
MKTLQRLVVIKPQAIIYGVAFGFTGHTFVLPVLVILTIESAFLQHQHCLDTVVVVFLTPKIASDNAAS